MLGTRRSRLPPSGSYSFAVNKSQNHLTCEVLGPSSPKLILSLKLENQTTKASSQQKLVKILDPEAGIWQCLLSDKDKVLLESKVEGECSLTPNSCSPSCGIFLG